MGNINDEAMQFFCNIFRAYGVKDLPMRLLATLYLEPGEVSMEELSRRTGYSKASISSAMKTLEQIGTVERRSRPGSKKAYFYMEKSLVKLNIQKLQAAQEVFIKPMKLSLPPLLQRMRKKAKTKKDKERLKIMENYYSQVNEFESIIRRWKRDLERFAQKQ